MNKHKIFIKDCYEGKHGTMCQEWKDTILEHYPEFKKEEFKEGDWAVFDKKPVCWASLLNRHDGTNEVDYPYVFRIIKIRNDGEYTAADCGKYGWSLTSARKATPKEIEQHLIQEAKKRGLDKNDFESLSSNTNNEMYDISKWYYKESRDTLYSAPERCGGKAVYSKGKWAEIIPTMTKEEAEKKLNCKIV